MQTGYNKRKGQEQPLDLDAWSKDWLQTKGVNKMTAEVDQANGVITKFKIK